MISHFFIRRPIFAAVLAIVITLAGLVAVINLPVAQYPAITPPSIMVSCTYPGADARVVAESVAAPIEQEVNGVEDMLYMVSQSNNDGSYTLTVTFKPGVDLNFVQVLVQNRVNLALPLLPDVVKQAGVTTRKRNPDILQVLAVYSPHGRYGQVYLSNYVNIHIRDEIARVEGVGDCIQFGLQDYSMRIWVDPQRLAEMGIAAADVVKAVREQNMQVAAGRLGQQPNDNGLASDYPITVVGRLSTPEQFGDIILRTDPEGRQVRVKDVARVELGARNMDASSKVDGMPNASLAVWALPDANAIATAQRVIKRMNQLKKDFPEDMDYTVSLDMTPFMTESIKEVIRTLLLAVSLVAVVVLVFLQNWRSALIPLLTVPVAIIGTFAVMAAIGFSLNSLTLFGLVLAIGIVVDDAIVVVECIERHIEEGMTPHQAAHQAMNEVSGPVVAVALVLSAVFVPCAFISGITGEFFRQFALTIASSTILSAFTSLTLSPALAALLLAPRGARKDIASRVLDFFFGWFFRLFNWALRRGTTLYTSVIGLALRGSAIVLLLYGGLVALTWWTSRQLPEGYIPEQDQGRFYIAVQLPDAASLQRSQKALDKIQRLTQDQQGVEHTTEIAGMSFTLNANGSNLGQFFVSFKPFEERTDANRSANAIVEHVQRLLDKKVPEAKALLRQPPPVSGLGSASGFKIIIEDRNHLGLKVLQEQVDKLIAAGNGGHFKLTAASLDKMKHGLDRPPVPAVPEEVVAALQGLQDHDFLTRERFLTAVKSALTQAGIKPTDQDLALQSAPLCAENRKVVSRLFSVFRANIPQLYADINRKQCQTMGVNPRDVFDTLQVYLGSLYVNDFNRFGRTWQVIVQADGSFRDSPDKVKLLKVRNNRGDMAPLSSVCSIREIGGPINIGRYNMYEAAAILGNTEPGVSSGQGIEEMEQLCHDVLRPGMDFEWTEINYMQIDADKSIANRLIFPLAVVFVFLVLAAQYESWSLPMAVILVVPLCILGSLTGVAVTRGDVNIFTQIGFVVLVGLASKNAVLIVEFAKKKHEAGLSRREATLQAVRLRLRPILMTSFAFILGVVPLLIGKGAGYEMRQRLGIAVFSGMIGVTTFGVFLTPIFFNVVGWLQETKLFRSKQARGVGRVLTMAMRILTLGVFWLPRMAMHGARRTYERSTGRRLAAGTNGQPTNGATISESRIVVLAGDHKLQREPPDLSRPEDTKTLPPSGGTL